MNRNAYSFFALTVATAVLAGGCERAMPPDVAPVMSQAETIRNAFGGGLVASVGGGGPTEQPTGWATLRGTFKLNGTAPSPVLIRVDKEIDICAPGGLQHFSEALVVSGEGGIKNVVIYVSQKLPNEEPWTHPTAQAGANTDEVVFDQKNCVFTTHLVAMQTSQTLKALNSDATGHNIKMESQGNGLFNQMVPANGQLPMQFANEEREPFKVACSVHPWMAAFVITRINGYFAVTDENGQFEIPSLPAGVDLEFRAWQESSGFLGQVVMNGNPTKWSKGKFVFKVDPDDESSNQLDVQVDVSAFN